MASSRTPLKKVPIHLQSAQLRLFIKGGRIVNDDQSAVADIYIEDGVIKQIGNNLVIPGGSRTIDAKGKLIIPGGIDTCTHFEHSVFGTTSADDFYSGTKAALAGGTTTIIDYVIPDGNQSLVNAYKQCRESADSKVCCDYLLHVCVTSWNDKVSQEMEILVKDNGVNSFHVFMANVGEQRSLPDSDIYQILRRCKQLGVLLMVHAENGCLIEEKTKEILSQGVTGPEGHVLSRPEEAEAEAVFRIIALASLVNAPIYVTKVMSRLSADVIHEHRRKGKIVFGEVIPAALAFDGSQYFNQSWRHAAGYVVSPPLRLDSTTSDYLADLLANDDLQVTGSDHCAFDTSQKAIGKDDFRKIPSGVNGVEDRLSVVWEKGVATGKMDASRFVAVTSATAAKVFNLYPRKGRIAIGSDADLVIWDPSAVKTISSASHQQKADFNIFEGLVCHGTPSYVINGGCVSVDEEGLHVTQGSGRFVSAPPGSEFVYGRIREREKLNKPTKVNREPYSGPALTYASNGTPEPLKVTSPFPTVDKTSEEFHNRMTRSGGRHLQDSSFSLSGAQIDDAVPQRAGMKVSQPPGGKSSALW